MSVSEFKIDFQHTNMLEEILEEDVYGIKCVLRYKNLVKELRKRNVKEPEVVADKILILLRKNNAIQRFVFGTYFIDPEKLSNIKSLVEELFQKL